MNYQIIIENLNFRLSIPLLCLSTCCRNGFSSMKSSACLAAIIMVFQERISRITRSTREILFGNQIIGLSIRISNMVVGTIYS